MQSRNTLLKDPDLYHARVLALLGKKFLPSNALPMPDYYYAELGQHFIRKVNGDETRFSPALKAALRLAVANTSIANSMQAESNNHFSFFMSEQEATRQSIGVIQNKLAEIENELEQKTLSLMEPTLTHTYGFHQLRFIHQVAEEIKQGKPMNEKQMKMLDYKVFKLLKNPDILPEKIIQEAREALDIANAIASSAHAQPRATRNQI